MLVDTVGYLLLIRVITIVVALVNVSLLDAISGVAGHFFYSIAVMILYYVPSEVLFGRTLGKLVTGTRVVTETGGPPTFAPVLTRTTTRLIPAESLTFFRKPSIGLHDRWSNTRVVRIRKPSA